MRLRENNNNNNNNNNNKNEHDRSFFRSVRVCKRY